MNLWISTSVAMAAAAGCGSRSGASTSRARVAGTDTMVDASRDEDGRDDAMGGAIDAVGFPSRCGEAAGPLLDPDESVHAAVALGDGSVLLSGGRRTGGAWTGLLDPRTGTRTSVDIPGDALADRMLTLTTGDVLVIGHSISAPMDRLTVAARLNVKSNKWGVLPPPPKCLTDDAATLREESHVTVELTELPDNVVLAVGHRCAAYLVSSKWVSAPVPPTQRRGFSLTTLSDGDVLRVGGLVTMARDFDLEPSGGVERFDVKRRRWQRVASMRYTRHAHTSTLRPDGTVVVIGGCEGSGPVCNGEGPSPPVEIYNPAADRWTVVGAAPITDRWAHTATLLGDGRIVGLGGYAHPEYSPRPTAILIDDRWFEAPAPVWRGRHLAIALGDHVLLAGPGNLRADPGDHSPLLWYGVAADCPTNEVRLGPALFPPDGGTP